ncbi:hypothetical protein NW754_002795 [Fusarium falciforme]|nr:hypothetical protein NW754_002795 [Fusarium falciforme]
MAPITSFMAAAILAFGGTSLAIPTNNPIQRRSGGLSMTNHAGNSESPVPKVKTLSREDLKPFGGQSPKPSNITDPLKIRAIIGPDDRVLWGSQQYPYSAIGRISGSDGGSCSAALVGPRHVATAKHCVPPEGVTTRFQPMYFDGGGPCFQMEDWAIFILADRLGDSFGYLGATTIDCDAQKKKPIFLHVGYPGDKGSSKPYRQEGISVVRCADCAPGGPLETDADGIPGQSGGPLWLEQDGTPYLYGVLSGVGEEGTGFASGQNLVNAISKARADYP